MKRNKLTNSNKLASKKNANIQQLVKDWESAKKRVNKELKKEKNKDKKIKLELFVAYLENNFIDEEGGVITSKYEKRDLTNICGPKEFNEKRWRS